jgi:hypothetical protein
MATGDSGSDRVQALFHDQVSKPSMQVIYEDVWLCNSIAQIDKLSNRFSLVRR